MRTTTCLITALVWLAAAGRAWACPSSTFWTPCTITIQTPGTTRICLDNYWSGYRGSGPSLQSDLGVEWAADLGGGLNAEYGVDASMPGQYPWYFNAKVGYPEQTLSPHAPALQLGFYCFGTQPDLTNQNIVYLVTGLTLPDGKTQVAAAYWIGHGAALRSSTGEVQDHGYMASLQYELSDQMTIVADYESGRNVLGAGGVGLNYSFSDRLNLVAGPVWFNDRGLNGGMKWTTQWSWTF